MKEVKEGKEVKERDRDKQKEREMKRRKRRRQTRARIGRDQTRQPHRHYGYLDSAPLCIQKTTPTSFPINLII